jgi:hypothetical protein
MKGLGRKENDKNCPGTKTDIANAGASCKLGLGPCQNILFSCIVYLDKGLTGASIHLTERYVL